MAAKENLINIVQFLLNYGADISRKDRVNYAHPRLINNTELRQMIIMILYM